MQCEYEKQRRNREDQGRWLVSGGHKGSHQQFKHKTRKGRVTVPHPKASLAKGTLHSIERQSGVKLLQ
ncbi:MAG TPA: type II toxin-antitoxin system HicA family toxin [Sphingomicrobium sp.]|nr:type II toxin-antitoxin system HicA family toxin [Sphingomicrobium sp.]